jgi:hypothetical protein
MLRKENSATQIENDLSRAVVTMLTLKLRSGSTPLELRRFVDACLAEAIEKYKPSKKGEMVWLYQIARVLRTWHLETRFLTPTGKPKPLLLKGKDSLTALVLYHFSPRMVELVLNTMRRNGLIRRRRSGHWVPISRYARTPKPTVELLSHFAEGVSRLAETVRRNTTTTRAGELLLERAAQVSDLPRSEAGAFRRYVHTQGMSFLTTIDDWLESRSRSSPKRSKAVCNAGVFTFAFIDDKHASENIKRSQSIRSAATHPSTPASKSSRRSSSEGRS